MFFSRIALAQLSVAAVGLVSISQRVTAADIRPERTLSDMSLGEALFVHNWARPATWTRSEPLGNGGDGLGPVFNDVSCVACHAMGGVGGAGDVDRNVELLSVVLPHRLPLGRGLGLVQQAQELHPQIAPDNLTVMLHRSGFGAGDDTLDYDTWRNSVVHRAERSGRMQFHLHHGEPIRDVPWQLSQRNTPALWGAGEIERLRRANGDRLRERMAFAQRDSMHGVSGRIPRTADGRAGWLGWRGHVEHLPEFVQSACANELGLAVRNHPQPASPRQASSKQKPSRRLDLTNAQVVALTDFVGELPRPQQILPTDPHELEDVYAGERIFESIGCVQCHVPDVGVAKAIYSDLLLHDMGESLADPSTAFPERPPARRQQSNYSGGSAPSPGPGGSHMTRTNLAQEWRTPPLWGVADSPPYLHDGRASTLDDAIRLHGGEGKQSAMAYRILSEGEHSQVLAFLGTLRATTGAVAAVNGKP